MTLAGFPHSDIPGSKPVCGSPRLIAACHVLHRFSAPRHPPCTLSSLTKLECFRESYRLNPIQLSKIRVVVDPSDRWDPRFREAPESRCGTAQHSDQLA